MSEVRYMFHKIYIYIYIYTVVGYIRTQLILPDHVTSQY